VISIDTNVLLRYLLQDDKVQSPKANRLFSRKEKMLITDMVLIEIMWTLKGKKYNLNKQDQLSVLSELFKEPNIVFEDGQTVWRAMNSVRNTEKVKVGSKRKDADFADALVIEKSKFVCEELDEKFDGVYTFDVAAQQIDGTKDPK